MTLPDAPSPPLPENWIPMLYRELNGARLPLVASEDGSSLDTSPIFGEASEATEQSSESSDNATSKLSTDDGSEEFFNSYIDDDDVEKLPEAVPEDSESVETASYIPADAQSSLLSVIVNSFLQTLETIISDSPEHETISIGSMLTMFEDAKVIFLDDVLECMDRGISIQKGSQVSGRIKWLVNDMLRLSESCSSIQLDAREQAYVHANAAYTVLTNIVDSIWEAIEDFLCKPENKRLTFDELLVKFEATKRMIVEEVFESFYRKVSEGSDGVKWLLKDVMDSMEFPSVVTWMQEDSEDVPDSAETSEPTEKFPEAVTSIPKRDPECSPTNETAIESVSKAPKSSEATENVPSDSKVGKGAPGHVPNSVATVEPFGKSPEVVPSIQTVSGSLRASEDIRKDSQIQFDSESSKEASEDVWENSEVSKTAKWLIKDGRGSVEASESSETSPEVATTIRKDSEKFKASEDIPKGSSIQLDSEGASLASGDVPKNVLVSDSKESTAKSPKSADDYILSILSNWDSRSGSPTSPTTSKLPNVIPTSLECLVAYWRPSEDDSIQTDSEGGEDVPKDFKCHENATDDSEGTKDALGCFEASGSTEKSPEDFISIHKKWRHILQGKSQELILLDAENSAPDFDYKGDSESAPKAPESPVAPEDVSKDSEVDESASQASEFSEKFSEIVNSIRKDSEVFRASEDIPKDIPKDSSILRDSDRTGNIISQVEDLGKVSESSEKSQEDLRASESALRASEQINSGTFKASEDIPRGSPIPLNSEGTREASEDFPTPKNFKSILRKWKAAEILGIPESSYFISSSGPLLSEFVSSAPESSDDLIMSRKSSTEGDSIQVDSESRGDVPESNLKFLDGDESTVRTFRETDCNPEFFEECSERDMGTPIMLDSEDDEDARDHAPTSSEVPEFSAKSLEVVPSSYTAFARLRASEDVSKDSSIHLDSDDTNPSTDSVLRAPEAPADVPIYSGDDDSVADDAPEDSKTAESPVKSPITFNVILNQWKDGKREASLVHGNVEICRIEDVQDQIEAVKFSEKTPEVLPSIRMFSEGIKAAKHIPMGSVIGIDTEDVWTAESSSSDVVTSIQMDSEAVKAPEDIEEPVKSVLRDPEDDESLPPLIEKFFPTMLKHQSSEKSPEVVPSVQMHSGRFRASEDVSKDSEDSRSVAALFQDVSDLVEDSKYLKKCREYVSSIQKDSGDVKASEVVSKDSESPKSSSEGRISPRTSEGTSDDSLLLQSLSQFCSSSPKSSHQWNWGMYREEPNAESVLDEYSYSIACNKGFFVTQNCLEGRLRMLEEEKAEDDVPEDSVAVKTLEEADSSVEEVPESLKSLEFPEKDSDVTSELSLSILIHAEAKHRIEDPSELSILIEESTENVTEGLEAPENVMDLAVNPEDLGGAQDGSHSPEAVSKDGESPEDVIDIEENPKDPDGIPEGSDDPKAIPEGSIPSEDVNDITTNPAESDVILEGSGTSEAVPEGVLSPEVVVNLTANLETSEDAPKSTPNHSCMVASSLESGPEESKVSNEFDTESKDSEDSPDEDPEAPKHPSTPKSESKRAESPIDDPKSKRPSGSQGSSDLLHALLTEEIRLFLVENLILQSQGASKNALRSIDQAQAPNWDALRVLSAGNMASGLAENFPNPEQFLDVYTRVVQFKARSLVVQSQMASRNAQRSFRLQTLLEHRRSFKIFKGIQEWAPLEDFKLPMSIQRLQKVLEGQNGPRKLQKSPEVEKLLQTLGFSPDLAPQVIRRQAEILQETSRLESRTFPGDYISQSPNPRDHWVHYFNRDGPRSFVPPSLTWQGTTLTIADVLRKSAQLNAMNQPYSGNFTENAIVRMQTPSGTLVKYRLPRRHIRDRLNNVF